MKPLKASTVSRRLGRKFTRSEYLASVAVRGWGTFTAGFECRQWSEDVVKVEYIRGDSFSARTQDAAQRKATVQRNLTRYKDHLDSLGYLTELDLIQGQLFVEQGEEKRG